MAPTPTPLPANASLTTGPLIIGIVLNWFFYGILVMQYFVYLNTVKNERKWLQVVVHFLFLLDTVQSIIVLDDAFYWFVHHFNDFSSFGHFNFSLIDGPFLDSIIMFTVQIVYCWRIRRLGGWRVISVVTAFIAFMSCACGMFAGIYSVVVDTAMLRKVKWVEELWLLTSAVVDISIASSMAYLLAQLRKEKSTRSTMVLLKRILLMTLETNAITAVIAIADVFTYFLPNVKEPNTNCNAAIGYVIGKLYSNCFMVLLNQRTYFEGSPVSGTMSTLGCNTSRNANSVQLSTIQFKASQALLEAQSKSISQAEPSNHDGMKDSMEMEMKIASSSIV